MNMNVDVANKLLNLRKKYGYSQEELAEKLGISRQAVSKWERAEASPDTENLIALAKLYNVSLDEIFEIDVIKSETINSRKSVSLKKDFLKKSNLEEKDENIMRMQEPIYSQAQKTKVEEKYPQKSFIEKEEENQKNIYENLNFEVYEEENIIKNENNQQVNVSENINYKALYAFPYPLFVALMYVITGSLFNWWHPMWLMFLTIPLYYTTITACQTKNLNTFCYPVLATLIYLISGFTFNLWHPGWLIFLTIPFYYTTINTLIKK